MAQKLPNSELVSFVVLYQASLHVENANEAKFLT
jgi:hypothetical protein